MSTKLVRLTDSAHERAQQLAELCGENMVTAVSAAIEEAYQKAFWASVGRQVRDMQVNDPKAWAAYQAESDEIASGDDPLDDYEMPETAASA